MRQKLLPRLFCRNQRCQEWFKDDDWWAWQTGLCPSCRYVGKVGFFLGGLIAGALGVFLKGCV